MNTTAKPIVICVLFLSLLVSGCGLGQVFGPTITPSPTLTPTLGIPTPTPLPAECSEFGLTPQECANAGTHEYSASTEILHDRNGKSCFIEDSNITISHKFLAGGDLHYTDSYGTEIDFAKKADNFYTGAFIQPDGDFAWSYAMLFTDTGITSVANSYGLVNNERILICTFVIQQIVSASSPATFTPSPADTPAAGPTSTPEAPGGNRLPGQTIVDATLQKDVLGMINTLEGSYGCKTPKIKDTKLTSPSVNGSWKEDWSVDRCGTKTVIYQITFTASPSGGTDFSVTIKQ